MSRGDAGKPLTSKNGAGGGLISGARDEYHPSPSDPIFAALSEAQKTLVDLVHEDTVAPPSDKDGIDGREWWKVAVLDSALQQQRRSWSKRDRQGAFEQIRRARVTGWFYKRKGKRSAYFLETLQSEPSLPKEFRPTVEDLKRTRDTRVRDRILQLVRMALEDYRTVNSRGSEHLEEDLRKTIEPYVESIDSMMAAGDPNVPSDWRWRIWKNEWIAGRAKEEFDGVDGLFPNDIPPDNRAQIALRIADRVLERANSEPGRLMYRWLLRVREYYSA